MNKKRLDVYLVGVPGSGKSTLREKILADDNFSGVELNVHTVQADPSNTSLQKIAQSVRINYDDKE